MRIKRALLLNSVSWLSLALAQLVMFQTAASQTAMAEPPRQEVTLRFSKPAGAENSGSESSSPRSAKSSPDTLSASSGSSTPSSRASSPSLTLAERIKASNPLEIPGDPATDFIHQGHFIHRNAAGQPIAEGDYHQGKRTGLWKRWYHAGEPNLFAEAAFTQFKRPLQGEVNFVDGKPQGEWTVTDADGQKLGSWPFNNQLQLHGTVRLWHPNQQKMREATYEQGVLSGKLVTWNPQGQALSNVQYLEGLAIESHSTRYAGGQKQSEGSYLKAGMVEQHRCDWWTGKIVSEPLIEYANDSMHGQWTTWYENGQLLSQGEFKLGKPQGTFTWWFANGQAQIEGTYVDGKQSGRWVWWYNDGMPERRGQYAFGDPIGRWTSYHTDGSLREVEENYTADTPTQSLSAHDPLAPQTKQQLLAQRTRQRQPVVTTPGVQAHNPKTAPSAALNTTASGLAAAEVIVATDAHRESTPLAKPAVPSATAPNPNLSAASTGTGSYDGFRSILVQRRQPTAPVQAAPINTAQQRTKSPVVNSVAGSPAVQTPRTPAHPTASAGPAARIAQQPSSPRHTPSRSGPGNPSGNQGPLHTEGSSRRVIR